MPESAQLTFARPPGFEHLTNAELEELVTTRVKEAEDRFKAQRRAAGARILGRRAVLAQDWRARPNTREPRRNLNPRVAARSKWSRIEAIMRSKTFRETYLAARKAFVNGFRNVVFPLGTYWLRRFAGVACVPIPM